MGEIKILHPFTSRFLADFILTPSLIPFADEEVVNLDKELTRHEQIFLNPEISRNLISRNELLASFAISKAEKSQLTLAEAKEVYELVLGDPDYNFIAQKLKIKKSLTQKDHDRLEFFNIARTFRLLNRQKSRLADLNPEFIRKLHRDLTLGLDLFKDYLADFTVYKSGNWRDNDLIRVGNYAPATYPEIPAGIKELVNLVKNKPRVSSVAIFHTGLYALHPFNNGNKRVGRVLEHWLFRSLGLNAKNLYSTSYYYHQEKPRYYRRLLNSLERKNLNHFCGFVFEALVLLMAGVLKTSLAVKRQEFITGREPDKNIRLIVKPLVKRREVQFKQLINKTQGKMARQTFVNYLDQAVKTSLVSKRIDGKKTYYCLNFDAPETESLNRWLKFIADRLTYLPDSFKNV